MPKLGRPHDPPPPPVETQAGVTTAKVTSPQKVGRNSQVVVTGARCCVCGVLLGVFRGENSSSSSDAVCSVPCHREKEQAARNRSLKVQRALSPSFDAEAAWAERALEAYGHMCAGFEVELPWDAGSPDDFKRAARRVVQALPESCAALDMRATAHAELGRTVADWRQAAADWRRAAELIEDDDEDRLKKRFAALREQADKAEERGNMIQLAKRTAWFN